MPTAKQTLSLIVPALNEESVVGDVLAAIYEQAERHFLDFELIAIDDGSTDATGRIMEEFAAPRPKARVLHNRPNIGLGASFRRGLEQARFQYVMLLCGDGGLPARSLPAIFDRIGTADLVLPYMSNLRKIKSPARYLISRTYTQLLNMLFGYRIRYYNGLPVYRRSLVRAVNITSDGFGFQGEIVVKLLKSGCTYVEVGVEGAEEKHRSVALKPKSVFSVGRTLSHLVWEIARFKPVPSDVVERSRIDEEEFGDRTTGGS
jgi:glycosyltransferase involved in cell wall biosynthesis